MRARGFVGGYRRITAIERDAAGSRTGQAGACRTGDDGRSPALSCGQRHRRSCRSLASAVAPHPRLADVGADIRAPGLGLGAGGNVSRRRPVHGLAQYGAVRRRISQTQFSRLGPLSQRHDRNGPDRNLGHGAGRLVRHPVLDPEREQYLPAVDRAADPAADGRLPRHQRDRVRADVRRCGRPRSLRRRHGDFRSQSRCVSKLFSEAVEAIERELQEVVFGVVPR